MNEDWTKKITLTLMLSAIEVGCEIIERIENKTNEVAVLFEEKESAVGKENSR